MRKKTKKRIAVLALAILLIFLALITFPPAEFDKYILGDNFEEHIKQKYSAELVDEIFNKNIVYSTDKKDYISYYGDDISVQVDLKITKVSGRTIRCSLPVIYKNEEILIEFEGRKIIGDIYDWEMLPNNLFPIDDSSIIIDYAKE